MFHPAQKGKQCDLMLSLMVAIDHLAVSHSVHWYVHVLRREDDYEMVL